MQIFPGFDVRILEDIGGIDSPLEPMIEAKGSLPARPSRILPVADDTRTDFALEGLDTYGIRKHFNVRRRSQNRVARCARA